MSTGIVGEQINKVLLDNNVKVEYARDADGDPGPDSAWRSEDMAFRSGGDPPDDIDTLLDALSADAGAHRLLIYGIDEEESTSGASTYSIAMNEQPADVDRGEWYRHDGPGKWTRLSASGRAAYGAGTSGEQRSRALGRYGATKRPIHLYAFAFFSLALTLMRLGAKETVASMTVVEPKSERDGNGVVGPNGSHGADGSENGRVS